MTNFLIYFHLMISRGSSVSILTRLRAGLPGRNVFFFAAATRSTLGPTQSLIQWL